MIPIPGFENIKCDWVTIQGQGFHLYGFFLYTASDHYFPEYMESDGLMDLDLWTGEECAVFIVQSPSQQWIEYARETNHIWWKLFGKQADFLQPYQDAAVLQTSEGLKTIREVFAPCLNQYLHTREIAQILHWFGLNPTEHPCMVLFKDLYRDRSVWYVDLRDTLNVPKYKLRISLQQWFDGSQFKKLLKEARNA